MSDYLLQEDGTSKLVLEDGSGYLELEGTPGFTASFIASTTVVYGPTVTATDDVTFSVAGTYSWLCPAGVTYVSVEAWGGGGGGGLANANTDGGGGGGGAYAKKTLIPVTPGTTYTVVVGAGGTEVGGNTGNPGGDSSFTGDSSSQVLAKGGAGGPIVAGNHAQGGQAASSVGDTKFSGGDGGATIGGAGQSGGGGGASGNRIAAGAAGSSGGGGGTAAGGAGGSGSNGGGSGGTGGGYFNSAAAVAGSPPGGGGGGAGGNSTHAAAGADGQIRIVAAVLLDFIASTTVVHAPQMPIEPAFIASATVVYAPTLPIQVAPPFIGSVTVVYTPDLPEVHAPFIASKTHVWNIFSRFDPNRTYSGPGNGGETSLIRLAPNGTTETATLAADITAAATALTLTGDGSLPSSMPFVATIDSEVVYLVQTAPGSYRIRARGVSNTTAAAHMSGATVSWGDSYDMALVAVEDIGHSFTADISGSGSTPYDGWLVCFDSSQAYLAGDRYPMHVAELLGVFDAGAGSGGTSRCDGAQPNAVSTPTGVSDHCPTGLCNPARITTDIAVGDVALVRYVNPEAVALDLGPRAPGIQSWFGLKRVDTSDNDVTTTDPNGIVVDTTGTYDTFTGAVNGVWAEPLPLETGIAPDASDLAGFAIDTPGTVPWQTVTLPGADRFFTDDVHYSEKGWPFGVLAVRNGNRRIPLWQSWDWHDFTYVFTGFGDDCSFAQVVVNRNGAATPGSALPGPQDIDGPDAVWDDASYYYGASWFVAIYGTPYLVIGPSIGGSLPPGEIPPFLPFVSFPSGAGGGAVVTLPGPSIEGGSGGDIAPAEVGQLFQAASV